MMLCSKGIAFEFPCRIIQPWRVKNCCFKKKKSLLLYHACERSNWSADTNEIKLADWKKLPAVVAHKGFDASTWVDSGLLSLSDAPSTYLAFVYSGSGKTTKDGTFELDDIRITEKIE